MERAKVLFGCYRRGDANDPDQYVASIAAVLTLYDPEIIRDVTDPRTGISTTEKFSSFMPNSGELKIFCDEIRQRRARVAHLGALNKSQQQQYIRDERPGRRANLLVHADAPQYPQVLEWVQTADEADWKADEQGRGVWVNYLASPLGGLRCGPMHALKRQT
jgi:hypothetical protein